MTKYKKHPHGHINPIMNQEELSLLAALDRTLNSTSNSAILGVNGEIGLRNFLNRYLPNCFKTVSGHFATPSGKLSPQIDLMVIDSRYPLLSENEDGSVVAMLHSVLAAIEVKLSITSRDVQKIIKNNITIEKLEAEVFDPGDINSAFLQPAFGYRAKIKLKTIAKHFFVKKHPRNPGAFLKIMRIHKSDQDTDEGKLGVLIARETNKKPIIFKTLAPLSDYYYQLVQNMYYALSARNFGYDDIGRQMPLYMNWGTYSCFNRRKT